jgi:hypothetical protein
MQAAHVAATTDGRTAVSNEQSLIGVWRLVSYEARLPDGTDIFPLGAGATGMIIWDSDGAFSAQISPGEAQGMEPEYVAYYGTWEFDGTSSEVVHHVEGTANAVLHDPIQRRRRGEREVIAIERDLPMEAEGVTATMSLTWVRDQRKDRG